jgi:hypothetical protein
MQACMYTQTQIEFIYKEIVLQRIQDAQSIVRKVVVESFQELDAHEIKTLLEMKDLKFIRTVFRTIND